MLATDKALPILHYEALEGLMKESELVAWKNTKQVAIEIPEDVAEVKCSRVAFRWERAPQNRP